MATFITIGYGDRAGYDRTDPEVRDRAHAADQALVERGTVMGMAGEPVQVRNHDGSEVGLVNGPFAASALPVAGFAVIEAESLAEAIELAAKSPCAVAQGVVEVWPLQS
ncbi:hypothetical protein ABIE44_003446 [Marmoricola sp. OAE513]|uniref:YciI family protein n=1 Tax=Marmoricola sp. OAE513 TaxID=2817894 RepID=UPI001AE21369